MSIEVRDTLWCHSSSTVYLFLDVSYWSGVSPKRWGCQSIPWILLSPTPEYWNYYQVTMYSLVGSWWLSSGPDSCQASPKYRWFWWTRNLRRMIQRSGFFFLYQGLHFEEMMVMHPVNIFPSMPCSKGDQWCSCGSNWEGPPGEQVWKSPVQLGELDQKERQHHTRPCCMVPAP